LHLETLLAPQSSSALRCRYSPRLKESRPRPLAGRLVAFVRAKAVLPLLPPSPN
jgi:hypothetical protein